MRRQQLAEALAKVLVNVPPGALFSYTAFTEVTELPFGDAFSRQVLRSALDICAREVQPRMFRTVKREGLVAFGISDYENAARKRAAQANRAVRRGISEIDAISTAEFQKLSNRDQLRHSIRQQQMEVLIFHSNERRFEKVVKRNDNRSPSDFNMRNVAQEFADSDLRKPKRETR